MYMYAHALECHTLSVVGVRRSSGSCWTVGEASSDDSSFAVYLGDWYCYVTIKLSDNQVTLNFLSPCQPGSSLGGFSVGVPYGCNTVANSPALMICSSD